MGGISKFYRSARSLGVRQRILVALAILGALCAGAGAQIEVVETGLHDGESVYGLYVPAIPFVNWDDISLYAWGETNPDLYANVSFTAYGLYGETDLDNVGWIGVVATGGAANTDGLGIPADAQAVAFGVFTAQGALINDGWIDVTAFGGEASATLNAPMQNASAAAVAFGLYAADGGIDNIGPITVGAKGGLALADGDADAGSFAYGLVTDNGGAYNDGDVMVTALGGEAETGNGAYADASATGLSINGDVANTGYLDVASAGGTATTNGFGNVAQASAQSFAGGIEAQGTVDNSGAISAVATGGSAEANKGISAEEDVAWADALVDGIFAGSDVYNSGSILADALGGTADAGDNASATASARGIRTSGPLDNYGSLHVIAAGGTATGWAATGSYAGADAEAWALSGYDLNNFGALTVTATGGTADGSEMANAFARAYGIRSNGELYNSGLIDVTAAGGAATAGPGSADANAFAYGIYSPAGLIENRGWIDVAAWGGTVLSGATGALEDTSAAGLAYGLYAEDGAISNAGRIRVTAQGGEALADGDANTAATTYGVFTGNGEIGNSGAVTVTALGGTADLGGEAWTSATATGLAGNSNLDNTGNVAVAALGGTATTDGTGGTAYADAYAYSYGISAQGMVTNSGHIAATATGGSASAISSMSPYIGAFADAYVYGLVADTGVNPSGVTNSGSMAVTATGGTSVSNDSASAYAIAHGMWSAGILNNSGSVFVTATGGTAAGPYAAAAAQAYGLSGYDLTNSGAVTVVATGGTANAGDLADTSSYAEGLGGGPVTNTGAISVTAAAGTATGSDVGAAVIAVGISAGDTVYNSGPITVAATTLEGSTAMAYGIRMNSNGNLTNTGVIRATADTAYEVYVGPGTTTTFVDTYNVTLDGDPSRGSLGVADGATLALNNATLTATAIFGETLWNTQYKLFETAGTGAVAGSFGDVRAANPNTTVTYYDQDSVESVDDEVALAYTPIATPALASATVEKQVVSQAADVVNRHMTSILLQNLVLPRSSGLLADAGSTAESLALAKTASGASTGIFVEPYYSLANHDADPLGYDAGLWGFSAGCERFLENTLLGLHLGYGQGDIDYTGSGFRGNSEEQDVVTGGFNGLTRWDPWVLHYGLTGFYGSHDYEGRTGLSLEERETASFHSYGTAATLMAGPMFRCGPHVFLPEAGINWLWVHRPRYTTEATDPSWDTTFSTLDEHDVYAAAALQWLSSFLCDDIRVTPSAALGVRYLLTDTEAGTWQSVPGIAPVLVRSEQDRTALTLSGALVLTRDEHALTLAYDGDYSPDVQRHSFWLRYSWLF